MHFFHGVHTSVALDATDASGDMRRMVEVRKVAQFVHLDPLNGHSRFVALAHWLKPGALAMDLRMAVHARLCGRHRSVAGGLDGGVAVPTIHSQSPRMGGMAKGNGLHRLVLTVQGLGAKPVGHEHRQIQRGDGPGDQRERQECVRPSWEEESAHLVPRVVELSPTHGLRADFVKNVTRSADEWYGSLQRTVNSGASELRGHARSENRESTRW